MTFRESETVELKRTVTDDIKKEIIAFANCDGGTVYIGVEDDGAVAGLGNADQAALQVSNMVRDAIKPDLTMSVHYETVSLEGRDILKVEVERGTLRPYYIARKGLRPEGVYVRQGFSAVPASDAAIRRMIKDADGDRYEDLRSLDQALTFSSAQKEFGLRDIGFSTEQMMKLKLMSPEGIYTNLGLLLSDQCAHTLKAAVFQGRDQSIFRDRREFSGSLLRQLSEAYEYIGKYNQLQASFQGLLRIDTSDYPEQAIREALLNVLVHRDYAFSASSLISIYEDRIEFLSVGGLVPGIELEDVMLGLSICRNQNLANVFYRLRLIEAYGTGIRKIMDSYGKSRRKPKIETSANAFKLTLPNINTGFEDETWADELAEREGQDPETLVLGLIKEKTQVTRGDVEALLGISASSAVRLLRRMVESGKIRHTGKGKAVRYTAGKEVH